MLGETAGQLQTLLAQADGNLHALDRASQRATSQLTALVDHVFWRAVQLILVLVAAAVPGALLYRVVARRFACAPGPVTA